MNNKYKILTVSDHPLVASGVAIQTRYMIEGLLRTGKYEIHSLGGARSHKDYRPMKVEPYMDDWIIYPVDGYGDQNLIRNAMDAQDFDAVWIMTDPRFYYWFFDIADELTERNCAVLYNHVWDEYPVPAYNKRYYQTCDFIGCISKLTLDIVQQLGMKDNSGYIPHAVDSNIFKPKPKSEIPALREKYVGKQNVDKFICMYNSRNARRKMTADVLFAFKKFSDKVGEDKALLFMHTDPNDEEGPNLTAVAQMLGIKPTQLMFSVKGQQPEVIADYYNMSDVLINISNNEGFGLSCLEALSCGTLAVVNKTGGLQDQIKDDQGRVFGACIEPVSKSIQGSQHIPYIYDCRVSEDQVAHELERIYNMSSDIRQALEKKAREWTLKAFSMQNMVEAWDEVFETYIGKHREGVYRELKVVNL